jgi:GNAT superfamily N-acetyltransferase
MGRLHIREADPADLDALVGELGQRGYFADRLRRQDEGLGVLLIAWDDGRPVGDVYLWLEPAEEAEIREHLPGVPLLNHLEIHVDHQSRGRGTELIKAAESRLAELGHDRVALAVEVTNEGAAKLYDRLGYREWPHDVVECYPLSDGAGQVGVEVCRVLVKALTRERQPKA